MLMRPGLRSQEENFETMDKDLLCSLMLQATHILERGLVLERPLSKSTLPRLRAIIKAWDNHFNKNDPTYIWSLELLALYEWRFGKV